MRNLQLWEAGRCPAAEPPAQCALPSTCGKQPTPLGLQMLGAPQHRLCCHGGPGCWRPPTQTSQQSRLGTCPAACRRMSWGCKDRNVERCQSLQPQHQLGSTMSPGESESQDMEPGKGQEKGSTVRCARALRGSTRAQWVVRNRAGCPLGSAACALHVRGSREHPLTVGFLPPPSPCSQPLGCHPLSPAHSDIPRLAPLPPVLEGVGERAFEGRAHWEPPETPFTFAFKH